MNVTGFWVGTYWYDNHDEPNTSFIANLSDNSSQITGSISESVSEFSGKIRVDAFVMGTRDGLSLDFAKVYDGASLFAHRVDYHGQISPDGRRISGYWVLDAEWTGGFEMTRELIAPEEEVSSAAMREKEKTI